VSPLIRFLADFSCRVSTGRILLAVRPWGCHARVLRSRRSLGALSVWSVMSYPVPRMVMSRVAEGVSNMSPRRVWPGVPSRHVSGRALPSLRAPCCVSVVAGRTLETLEIMSTLSTNRARACRVLVPCRPAPERAQGWGKAPRWHTPRNCGRAAFRAAARQFLETTHFQPCTSKNFD
jgi:hypothetical protein